MYQGTGIAEVELPETFKRKNVEDTEKALLKTLQERRDGVAPGGIALPGGMTHYVTYSTGSVSSNFLQHKQDASDEARARQKPHDAKSKGLAGMVSSLTGAGAPGGKGGGAARARDLASDDRAVRAFKRSEFGGARNK